MTLPFIGLNDINEYLRIDTDDDMAIIACDAASEIVRGYADQTFTLVEDDEVVLDGTGTPLLYLPERPIVTLDSVIQRNADLSVASAATLVSGADYILGEFGAVFLLNGAVWTEGRQNIYVTYSHGYDTVPSDVRMVALQIAARIYDVGQVENESTGSYSATYVKGGAGLTDFESNVLYRYRPAPLA